MIELCWSCGDKDISGRMKEHFETECPSRNLSETEQELLGALMLLDFCDHFCCGLPPRMCHARTLNKWLSEHGWTRKVD
jgi:hypothetical protein